MAAEPRTSRPLSSDLVLALVSLVPDELAAGLRMGLLDRSGAVQVAERLLSDGGTVPDWIEETALLLSDDYRRIDDLIPERADQDPAAADPLQVWLFLVLADLWNNRDAVADPLAEVESVYADFDYPEEMQGFVRFLPVPEGTEVGTAAIVARWRSYLDRRAEYYAGRSAS